MVDWNGLLDRKYNIQQQEADTHGIGAQAQLTGAQAAKTAAEGRASLDTAQAQQQAGLAHSQEQVGAGQAGLYGSEASLNQHRLAPAPDEYLQQLYHTSNPGSSGENINDPFFQSPGFNKGTACVKGMPGYAEGTPSVAHFDSTTGDKPDSYWPSNGRRDTESMMASKGANKVPGKGDGTVDKVPAMLAPGEAVLNRHAAEMMGRDKIAALNTAGLAARQAQEASGPMGSPASGKAAPIKKNEAKGKPPAGNPTKDNAGNRNKEGGSKDAKRPPQPGKKQGGHQELSKGTHEVRAGKSAQTPQIDPGALQALAGLVSQGGGAGMPMPQGAPPMRLSPSAGRTQG